MFEYGQGYSGYRLSSPLCKGIGGQEGAMWMLKWEAYLSSRGLEKVLTAGFDSELPAKETDVLNETDSG